MDKELQRLLGSFRKSCIDEGDTENAKVIEQEMEKNAKKSESGETGVE